jgi:quercetin dioxygenase-like cupin family protein
MCKIAHGGGMAGGAMRKGAATTRIGGKMQGLTMMTEGQLAWSPHPSFKGVRVASLVSKGSASVDCALVEIPASAEVAEHVHDHQDDILYVLRGSAMMWVESWGDLLLVPGSFLRIPKGTRHRPHGFSDDFRILNIWAGTPSP